MGEDDCSFLSFLIDNSSFKSILSGSEGNYFSFILCPLHTFFRHKESFVKKETNDKENYNNQKYNQQSHDWILQTARNKNNHMFSNYFYCNW